MKVRKSYRIYYVLNYEENRMDTNFSPKTIWNFDEARMKNE